MPDANAAMTSGLGPFCAQFQIADLVRRAQGNAIAAFGLGPAECSFQVIRSGSNWHLRDYGGHQASNPLLIVASPIKRPYIWDLAPSVSAIRSLLRHDFHVYLLEWISASRDTGNAGLDECTQAIADCAARISADSRGLKPVLLGHSLGGTLAAIYGALEPASIRALALLSAPVCFQPAQSRFRDALVSLVPSELPADEPYPGSLLSQISVLASPMTFIWSRLIDATVSLTDPHGLDVNARVERWVLDEAALPGMLMCQIIDWLYRDDRFCRGVLKIQDKLAAPSRLSAPTLAVINEADEIAPLASVRHFIDSAATTEKRIIEFPGELGTGLQHLAILVGRQAHARVWPEIFSWLNRIR